MELWCGVQCFESVLLVMGIFGMLFEKLLYVNCVSVVVEFLSQIETLGI